VRISAIGGAARLVNPNLVALDPPKAILLDTAAQGLLRFDAGGEIEPALAQSWIVSDDGLRYTMRIRRAEWAGGGEVTAQQVVARLRAAHSRASRNPLKPVLGAIDNIVAMTDEVIEISLKGPRPNFLQLLAQPEMAIALGGQGTGPLRIVSADGQGVRLAPPASDDDEDSPETPDEPAVLLRGEAAPVAIARFLAGESDFVTGGTLGDLPFARTADVPADRLALDPAQGVIALAYLNDDGALGEPRVRRALAMAIDRQALAGEPLLAGFETRDTLVPRGIGDLAAPTQPDWAALAPDVRWRQAAAAIAALPEAPTLRVAMPDAPGYRILFAHLKRDWAAIGVTATRVGPDERADLALYDGVAPTAAAPWYLRRFTCDASPVCDENADAALEAARTAKTGAERAAQLANADRLLVAASAYIVLGAPLRWSLVAQRLNGFRPNMFARHGAITLIADQRR
jgi:peptide/nickel transport system substrate-binding protein